MKEGGARHVQIGRDQVERTAMLARLRLADDELDAAALDLDRILQYVEMLGEVDTTGVEPMTHGVAWTSVFVDDAIGDELPREAALANAPKHDGERYLVPAVLE